jgi:hypothetical protein
MRPPRPLTRYWPVNLPTVEGLANSSSWRRLAVVLVLLVLALVLAVACHTDASELGPVAGACVAFVLASSLVRPRRASATAVLRGGVVTLARLPNIEGSPPPVLRPPRHTLLEVCQT